MVQLTEYNQGGYIHIVISWLCLLKWIRDVCGWLREGKWCLRNLWLYYRTVRKCGWYRLWSCQQILFLPLSLRKLWFLLCLGLRYITSGSQMVNVSPPHCTICQLDEICRSMDYLVTTPGSHHVLLLKARAMTAWPILPVTGMCIVLFLLLCLLLEHSSCSFQT